jgi:hypothetical protein
MPFREISDACSENYKKQINIFCARNEKIINKYINNVKAHATYTKRCVLKGEFDQPNIS